MLKIPIEILEKYHISTNHLDDEDGIYLTFLMKTDYICNKIVEGISTREDYADELRYRQIAREELSRGDIQE